MGMTLCSTGYAESVSKLEYTKSLVSGLGFEIEDASEAYKKDTTKEENIIYTAFQMGLLKGVSWDFENPMTEDERQVILSNAMAIYNAQHDIEAPTEIDTNTDDAVQNDTAQEEPEEVNFMTEYGEVKAPSNLTPNENMWTDEEFADLIENDREHMYKTIPYNVKWKFDYDKKQFSIGKIAYDENGNRIYIPVDEMTNGRLFEMAKAVVYHAQLNGLQSSLYEHNEGRCSFVISNPDRGSRNIVIYLVYEPREEDILFKQVPDYQVGETNLLHEWELKRLIDAVAYEEKGINITNYEIEDVNKMFAEYQYTEQHFADFIYGVCDQIYDEDGLQMYKAIMGEYLNDMRNSALYDIDEDTSKHFETDNYNIYKYSPRVTWTYYGVNEK
jgi:hypothetical protein